MANNDLVNSLLKGLDILRVVAEEEEPVKLSELAKLMDMKPTTAHNLARTLCARNFLVKDSDSRYSLGAAVVDVARHYKDRGLMKRAAKVMQDLVRELQASTIIFGELIGPDMKLLMRYSPDQPFVLQKPQGQTFQPYANAAGLVGLAFGDNEQLEQLYVRYPYSEFGAHLWKEEEKLEAFLTISQEQGYVITPFDTDKTMRISAPIVDKDGKLLAIIGASTPVGCLSDDGDRKHIIDLILAAANKLNEK